MIKRLSKNLLMSEMIATDTGLKNIPSKAQEYKLFIMAQFQFQPLRDRFGAILVTSGFRNYWVNRRVSKEEDSQHTKAEAEDLVPLKAKAIDLFKWIPDNIPFGQCIYYEGENRLHLSMPRLDGKNQELFKYDGHNYIPVGLTDIV